MSHIGEQFKIVKSSKITWQGMSSVYKNKRATEYCADGDGIVVVVHYTKSGKIELRDQGELCATFDNLTYALEQAQNYLAATYHEIWEDARHWEESL